VAEAKRKPLSMLIAIGAGRKPGHMGGDMEADGGDEDEGDDNPKYSDEGMIAASEDMIDAFKNRDAKALNRAMCHWRELAATYEDEPASEKPDDDKSEGDY
jgi:hypothetical protein